MCENVCLINQIVSEKFYLKNPKSQRMFGLCSIFYHQAISQTVLDGSICFGIAGKELKIVQIASIKPTLSTFECNLCIQQCLLWVNSFANIKCKIVNDDFSKDSPIED